MIKINLPTKISQSRNGHHTYPESHEAMLANWGKPTGYVASREIRLEVAVDINYDEEHAHLAKAVIEAVAALDEAAANQG